MDKSAPDPGGVPDQGSRAVQVGRFNLAVFGPDANGKTTLVKAVFGRRAVLSGPGSQVAPGISYHLHVDGILGVYRSSAYDLSEEGARALSGLDQILAEIHDRPLAEQIHAAWYTQRWSDRGFDPRQAAFVRELSARVPVVFVLTDVPANLAGQQHQDAVRLARYVQAQMLPLSPGNTVFLTNSVADQRTGSPVHGLAELLEATFSVSPEAARRALTAAQMMNRERADGRQRVADLLHQAQRLPGASRPYFDAIRQLWVRAKPE